MEPVSAAVGAVLALVDWKKVAKDLAQDAAKKGAKTLLGRFRPDEREQAAKHAIELFIREFLSELEDKTPLSSAIPGYYDQLKRLIEDAAPDIAGWLRPETKEVDLGPVERMWGGLGLDPLPEEFDWPLVARNYAREIRKYVKGDPALRAQLDTALAEQAAAALERIAGPAPGFDLAGYRDYLRKRCEVLQLSAMHTSTYEQRIKLWNVLVPQSVRESAPVRELPRDLVRQLRREGHLSNEPDEIEVERYREAFASSAVSPVLDVLGRDRLIIVLGDPGSGKTSLLKFLLLRWVTGKPGPLPVWIDLKEYARERSGLLQYCESSGFRLDATELDKALKAGEAALYLDGLDEIFDGPVRGSVVEEIAALASRYPQARIVVTSRIVGYDPDRLRNAGFTHATLEDFDNLQVAEFISKWHEAAEQDLKERARLQRQLESALRESQAIRQLSGNPLLLTMMAILNRTQALPRDRVELYAQASRVLLHEWDASRSLPVDTFARQEKEELLRELAGVMQQSEGGLAGNLIERGRLIEVFRTFLVRLGVADAYEKSTLLVRQLTERNFILSYAGADRFSFVHRTFLEYFCAAWFVERFEKKQTLSLEQLQEDVFGRHWRDETWHEVLRLIAGMLDEKKAEDLIRYLIDQDGRNDKLANLMLAAECLSEVRNRRAIAATDERLRRLFVERVIRYDPPYYYETGMEDKEVLPTRTKAVGLIASVWRSAKTRDWLRATAENDYDWIVQSAAVQELARGWPEDPATLPWLKERTRLDEVRDVRRAAISELAHGWRTDGDTQLVLQESAHGDPDEFVRAEAIRGLAFGWKADSATLSLLQESARWGIADLFRAVALRALVRYWKDDPETLSIVRETAARLSRSYVERRAAIQELAWVWKDDPETLKWLKETIRTDPTADARAFAAQELARGRHDDSETLAILKESAESDKHGSVRRIALEQAARSWRSDLSIPTWLKKRARADPDHTVRESAVRELARGWKDEPETLPWLKGVARSGDDWALQGAAVQALASGWSEDSDALEIVTALARSDDSRVRREVLKSARAWKDNAGMAVILREAAVSDADGNVRWAAVEELARGWKDARTSATLKERARNDTDRDVRTSAMQELARGWPDDPETLAILKERARCDEDGMAREEALAEMARGWTNDPEIRSIVTEHALSDQEETVRHRALLILARFWKRDPGTVCDHQGTFPPGHQCTCARDRGREARMEFRPRSDSHFEGASSLGQGRCRPVLGLAGTRVALEGRPGSHPLAEGHPILEKGPDFSGPWFEPAERP